MESPVDRIFMLKSWIIKSDTGLEVEVAAPEDFHLSSQEILKDALKGYGECHYFSSDPEYKYSWLPKLRAAKTFTVERTDDRF